MLMAFCSMVDAGPVDVPYSAHIVFPSDHELRSAVFSPDGSSLYARVVVPAIDIWPILVWYWPEALGVLLGLFTLFALWRWRAVSNRRRERGKSYCRKCNYEVSGLERERAGASQDALAATADASSVVAASVKKCPECGKELTSRATLLGRSTARRLRSLLALWLIAALGYSSLFIFKLPRQGTLSEWKSWCRKDLADWATNKQNTWLVSKIKPCDRVIEIDPATGRIGRVVATLPSLTYFNLGISPDGRLLFLGARDDRSISCIDVASGGVYRTARLPGAPNLMVQNPAVIGFSPDGTAAYVQWHDRALGTSGVSAWDLSTNTVTAALTVPAYEDNRSGRPANWPRHFFVRFDDTGTPIFLSFPDFMESFPSGKYIIRMYELGRDARVFELSPPPDSHSEPAWRADDQQFIAVTKYGKGLSGWSLVDGSSLGQADTAFTSMGSIAHDSDVRFLAWGFANTVSVRDVVAKRWLARLRCPPAGFGARTVMSSDGTWCAAIFQNRGSTPSTHTFDLATWHLNAPELARQHEEAAKGK